MRKISGSDGCQMPDSSFLYPATHRWTVHFQTLDPSSDKVLCPKRQKTSPQFSERRPSSTARIGSANPEI